MNALGLAGYTVGGGLLGIGVGTALFFGRRALVDAWDGMHQPAPVVHRVDPLADTVVLTGVVVPRADLVRVADVEAVARVLAPDFWLTSGWQPARSSLLPAVICDDILTGLPWQTLRARELTR